MLKNISIVVFGLLATYSIIRAYPNWNNLFEFVGFCELEYKTINDFDYE